MAEVAIYYPITTAMFGTVDIWSFATPVSIGIENEILRL